MPTATGTAPSTGVGIDPRGPRFTAAVTAVLLGSVLLLPTPLGALLTVLQAVLFGLGALRGVQTTPTAWVFRTWIRPRLGAPAELEDPAPPRFAQGVGLLFATVALAGFAAGWTLLAQVAIGFALVAALLNALFGFCLGCEVYLLLLRFKPQRQARQPVASTTYE
jgi:hypothetical protein